MMEGLHLIKYTAIALAFLAGYLLIARFSLNSVSFSTNWLQKIKNKPGSTGKLPPLSTLRKWTPHQLRRLERLLMVIGALFGFLFSGGNPKDPITYLTAVVMAGAGYLFPRLLLIVLQRQRQQALEMQLPDALELISNSMRAGLSVVQALEVVAKEASAPMSEEFAEVVRDCRLGLSPEDALEKMLKRWPYKDLELFVVASGVSLRTGGNLAEVAGRIIETVRERVRLKGRIESLTAQGKMSGWVVGLLPVVLLVGLTLLDPELMFGFIRHPLGITMLIGGLVMELIGAFFIKQIVNIET
jgi:Flp pilus assembly protein TadB